jgi:hypothetical protein
VTRAIVDDEVSFAGIRKIESYTQTLPKYVDVVMKKLQE